MKTPEEIVKIIYNRNYWISEDKLKELLSILFYVSLNKEEGRYPHFQIFIPFKGEELPFASIKFKDPVEINKEFLYRIAPGIIGRPMALAIHENNNTIFSVGIISAESSGIGISEDKSIKYTLANMFQGLIIRVESPGHFLIKTFLEDRTVKNYEYKTGEIEEVFDFNSSILSMLLSYHIKNSIEKKYGINDSHIVFIHGAIAEIVSNTSLNEHGAIIIFLPDNVNENLINNNLNIYQKIEYPKIGELIHDILTNYDLDIQNTINQWNYSINSISDITQVDGAIIFDSYFNLYGIRAEIKGNDINHDNIYTVFPNRAKLEKDKKINITYFGMRHRSAIRFANNYDGSYVIVISQDSEIRIITKKENDILICGPLKLTAGESPAC